MGDSRTPTFYLLAAFFTLFVAFLYGPTLTIVILSFQGPQGGMTFPMNGVSLHWFGVLWEGLGVVDVWAAFGRSLRLGLAVTALTVVISVLAGLAFRRRFVGSTLLFYVAIASLILPSIVVSLGIALEFRIVDDFITIGLMGGQQIASVGKTISVEISYLQFPVAAANAVVLLLTVLIMIFALTRLVDIRKEL